MGARQLRGGQDQHSTERPGHFPFHSSRLYHRHSIAGPSSDITFDLPLHESRSDGRIPTSQQVNHTQTHVLLLLLLSHKLLLIFCTASLLPQNVSSYFFSCHTHTQTHTQKHTHKHTHTHRNTQTHTPHTHKITETHTHTHTHTHTITITEIHAHTHTHTQTHTQQGPQHSQELLGNDICGLGLIRPLGRSTRK